MKRVTRLSNRGESVVVSYVLVLGLMTVLSALLISAAGGFLDTKNEEVTKTQAEITTEAIAAELEEVDKNARRIDENSSSTGVYRYDSEADKLIGQYPYRVFLTDDHPDPDTYTVRIEIQSVGIVETTNVTLYTIENVSTNTVSSGSSLTYVYQTGGNLTIGDADITVTTFAINASGDITLPDNSEFDGGVKTRNGGSIYGGQDTRIYGPLLSDGQIDTQNRLAVFGRVTAENTLNFGQNTTVTEEVDAGGSIQTNQNTTIGGTVESDNSITTSNATTIQGEVDAGNSINLGSNTTVGSSVTATSDIQTSDNTTIRDSISAGNSITFGEDNLIEGPIDADVDVSLGQNTKADAITAGNNVVLNTNTSTGAITAGAAVTVGDNSTVTGPIEAVTNVQLEQQSAVQGDITTGDDVTLNADSQVDGTIDANRVTLYDNTQVTGDVLVSSGSNLVCSGTGATINGQSCSDYKSNNY